MGMVYSQDRKTARFTGQGGSGSKILNKLFGEGPHKVKRPELVNWDKVKFEGASSGTDSPLSGALTPSGNDTMDNDLGTTKKRRKNSVLGQSTTLGSKSTLG